MWDLIVSVPDHCLLCLLLLTVYFETSRRRFHDASRFDCLVKQSDSTVVI